MIRSIFILFVLIVSCTGICHSQACQKNVVIEWSKCFKEIKDNSPYQGKIIYLEIKKVNDSLNIIQFSNNVSGFMQKDINKVVACMNSEYFENGDHFKLIYMHLHIDQLRDKKDRKRLSKKFKKENKIKGRTCLLWSGYSSSSHNLE